MKYKVLFECIHGSHLYGTNTPESDMDYKGVFMPDIYELLLGKCPRHINESSGNDRSKNTSDDTDREWFSLPEFIRLACEGETIALDMLHAHTYPEMVLQTSPEWDFIVKNKSRFYTKNMKAFLGYARKQAAKYGIKGSRMAALEEVYNFISIQSIIRVHYNKLSDVWDKLPKNDYCKFITDKMKNGTTQEFYEVLGSKYQNSMPYNLFETSIAKKWESYGERARAAKENNGIDWKAVSHALRAAYQLQEIYVAGEIKYPLYSKNYLLSVKKGERDFITDVQPELEVSINDVAYRAENSNYPDKVDRQFWDDWLLSIYQSELALMYMSTKS